MTDKRFIETLSTGVVTDTLTGEEYNCDMRISDELLELLNRLSEENNTLRNQIETFKEGNKTIQARLKELHDEKQNLQKCINEIYIISSRESVE